MPINDYHRSKETACLNRIDRLNKLAQRLGGCQSAAIENTCFDIASIHRGRWPALWRHFKYALSRTSENVWYGFRYDLRVWWMRHVGRMTQEEVNAVFESEDREITELIEQAVGTCPLPGGGDASN